MRDYAHRNTLLSQQRIPQPKPVRDRTHLYTVAAMLDGHARFVAASASERVTTLNASRLEVALHVLFVCTGNICRSPLAERLARTLGKQLGIPDFHTSSAGVRAVIGQPMHPHSAATLQELGGDPEGFAARQLTPRIASDADLILGMAQEHRNAVLELAPARLNRTFTLGEASCLASRFDLQNICEMAEKRALLAANELIEVSDPIGKDRQFHAEIGAQIAELLAPVVELCRRTSARAPG
jgi:protein-tyrosine phosphatase